MDSRRRDLRKYKAFWDQRSPVPKIPLLLSVRFFTLYHAATNILTHEAHLSILAA